MTALMYACQHINVEMTYCLLQYHTDVNIIDNVHGNSALSIILTQQQKYCMHDTKLYEASAAIIGVLIANGASCSV